MEDKQEDWATSHVSRVPPANDKYRRNTDSYAGGEAPVGGERRATHSGDAPIGRYVGQDNGDETPSSVKFVLSRRKQLSHRFTPTQWYVLNLTWGGWTGYARLGSALDMTAQGVQKALHEAERIAYELEHDWYPAWKRWVNGKPLLPAHGMHPSDKAVLDKHRKVKKGRRAIPEGIHTMGVGHQAQLGFNDWEAYDGREDPEPDEGDVGDE
jgi:hypothetical protein